MIRIQMASRIILATLLFISLVVFVRGTTQLQSPHNPKNNDDNDLHEHIRRRTTTNALDPRTVVTKTTSSSYTPQFSQTQTSIIRKDPSLIRYAAFGASSTWGSGLADRYTQAYPWLLSPNAKNFAIRAAGPNYPASCVYSLVGNQELDVIILEYFAQVKYGLIPLAKRLRERFPDAIIIILREWYPRLVVNQDGVGLRDWAVQKGYDRFAVHDPKMHKEFLEGGDRWHWELITKEELIDIQRDAADLVGGYILELPRPDEKNIADWINYADLFMEDYMHKSVKGHWEVYFRVKNLVDAVGVPEHPRRGQWGFLDSCHSWFETADPRGVQYSKTITMNKISDRGGDKYALEWNPLRPGIITVTNPSPEPMTLYLAYMTTGPPPSNYAPAEVTILDDNTDQEPIVLDPVAPKIYHYLFFVHVQTIAEIGLIPPGETKLRILQRGEAKWPFRLVSVVITKKGEGLEEFQRITASKLAARKKPGPNQYDE